MPHYRIAAELRSCSAAVRGFGGVRTGIGVPGAVRSGYSSYTNSKSSTHILLSRLPV